MDSSALRDRLAALDLGGASATLVGHGYVGREYVKALAALGVGAVRVCSRSEGPLASLRGRSGVEVLPGGVEALTAKARPGEVAIVGSPTETLPRAVRKLASLGFRRILVEKPVALRSVEIDSLAQELEQAGVEAFAAWNRVAYPSVVEARARVASEGGITSCRLELTEMIKPDWPEKLARTDLARWGVANTLHVVSLAQALAGPVRPLVAETSGEGRIAWHPHASVFVGAGVAASGASLSWHGDWTSPGRWAVEVHTRSASYRFCPLEELRVRKSALAEWEKVALATFAPEVKTGFAEELAGLFDRDLGRALGLVTLREAADLVRTGERIFGYDRLTGASS